MKLTKEEADNFNKASRLNDIRRWQDMNFVLGYEMRLSENPKHKCELCERLNGKYPKSFIWQGWHDYCHCYAIPVMADFFSKESSDDRVNEMRAALHGLKYESPIPKETIKHVPKAFIDWFLENRLDFAKNGNTPDFVTKNINLIMESYEHYSNQSV